MCFKRNDKERHRRTWKIKKEKQQENNFWSLELLGIPVRSLLQRKPCFTAGLQLWSGGRRVVVGVVDADKLCLRCVLICCKMFHHRHFVPFARRRCCANPRVCFFVSAADVVAAHPGGWRLLKSPRLCEPAASPSKSFTIHKHHPHATRFLKRKKKKKKSTFKCVFSLMWHTAWGRATWKSLRQHLILICVSGDIVHIFRWKRRVALACRAHCWIFFSYAKPNSVVDRRANPADDQCRLRRWRPEQQMRLSFHAFKEKVSPFHLMFC